MEFIEKIKRYIQAKFNKEKDIKYLLEKNEETIDKTIIEEQSPKISVIHAEATKSDKTREMLKSIGFERKFLSELINLEYMDIENFKKVMNFLAESKFSIFEMRSIIRHNTDVIITDIEELKAVKQALLDEGLSLMNINTVIFMNSYILRKKYCNNIKNIASFFREYGFDNWGVSNVFTENPYMLTQDISLIRKTFNVLESGAANQEDIIEIINNYPLILGEEDLQTIKKYIA